MKNKSMTSLTDISMYQYSIGGYFSVVLVINNTDKIIESP